LGWCAVMRWGAVEQVSMGKGMYKMNMAVPEMNLEEVDACLHWMSTELRGEWKGAQKKLWGRLKRRQEELLGRGIGSGMPKQGSVKVLTVEEARLLDEVRRLKAELRRRGG